MKSIINGELGDKINIEGSGSIPFIAFPDIETPLTITETGVDAESKSIFIFRFNLFFLAQFQIKSQ
jgi:hypothetical protein